MRSVTGVRTVSAPPEVAFARVADFSSTAEWDPGVRSATRLGAGPLGVGTRFEVLAVFLGRTLPMDYTITAYQPPLRLELVAEADTSSAIDRITFEAVPGGTRITWTLELSLRGVSRLGEPFMGPVLERLARKAMDGLKEDLDGTDRDETRRNNDGTDDTNCA